MFVTTNSLAAVKKYFADQLASHYSEREIKRMAQEIIQKRLNLSPTEWLLGQDTRVSESDLLHFRSMVKRLQQHEPFQYVIGETEFFGLRLKCTPAALIPRPETEELVAWIEVDYRSTPPSHGLDWCTGTGCIAFALKKIFPDLHMEARDVSQEALELAAINQQLLDLTIQLAQADALADSGYTDLQPESFDFWVSNPPYIPFEERVHMDQNVTEHEPGIALFVPDNDALVFYRAISQQAQGFLKPGGKLYFELHEKYATQTYELLQLQGTWTSIELRQDLQGKWRMLRAQK